MFGVTADGPRHFAWLSDGVKASFLPRDSAPEVIEDTGDCGFWSDAGESVATEHLFNCIKRCVIEALPESKVQRAAVWRKMCRDRMGRFE
jgi:hypothetical protein